MDSVELKQILFKGQNHFLLFGHVRRVSCIGHEMALGAARQRLYLMEEQSGLDAITPHTN